MQKCRSWSSGSAGCFVRPDGSAGLRSMDNLVWGTGEDAFLWDRGGDIQQYFGAVNSIFHGDLLSAAFSGDCQLGILSGVYGSGTAVAGSTVWRAASAANLLFGNFLKK